LGVGFGVLGRAFHIPDSKQAQNAKDQSPKTQDQTTIEPTNDTPLGTSRMGPGVDSTIF